MHFSNFSIYFAAVMKCAVHAFVRVYRYIELVFEYQFAQVITPLSQHVLLDY